MKNAWQRLKNSIRIVTAKRHQQYDFERFNLVECFHRKIFQTRIYIFFCNWHILHAGHKSLVPTWKFSGKTVMHGKQLITTENYLNEWRFSQLLEEVVILDRMAGLSDIISTDYPTIIQAKFELNWFSDFIKKILK